MFKVFLVVSIIATSIITNTYADDLRKVETIKPVSIDVSSSISWDLWKKENIINWNKDDKFQFSDTDNNRWLQIKIPETEIKNIKLFWYWNIVSWSLSRGYSINKIELLNSNEVINTYDKWYDFSIIGNSTGIVKWEVTFEKDNIADEVRIYINSENYNTDKEKDNYFSEIEINWYKTAEAKKQEVKSLMNKKVDKVLDTYFKKISKKDEEIQIKLLENISKKLAPIISKTKNQFNKEVYEYLKEKIDQKIDILKWKDLDLSNLLQIEE